jgi:glycine oxidase
VTVIVVGAGIVGSAIAHELAARGATVRLLDARGVGLGATRASAGMLAPHIEGHLPALLDLATRSLAMYDRFVHRVEEDSGQTIEYERRGTLQAALDDQEADALAASAVALNAAGIEHELLDGPGVRRVEPSVAARAQAGLLLPGQGYVRASQLTDALVAAALARGVLFETAAVERIESRSSGVVVTTSFGALDADAVVVASGTWSIPSSPLPAPPVRPIRGQLLHLTLDAAPASRVVWGRRCYLVPWRDGSVLVGATSEDVGFDERSTAEGVAGLLEAALQLMPSLARAGFREVRVGLRPRGVDELPHIGRSEMPGVFYALGHYRNGVLLAPLTAAAVADLVLDGRTRPEPALVSPGGTAGR